ncbi:redox-sensitive transcriptional activator SoxR [Halomonas sp. H10-9-1]|uniref:redox-sensitive transcriptional activator SoxR n=1 Tax=Halomonas sp. H10-9-1 TaxID=2950871 RepID=UPI0032E0063C
MAMDKPSDGSRVLSVGQVARRSGVPVSTLHFYETKGLIRSTRSAGNHRQYPATVLRYVAIIRVAQSVGMSLEEIGETLNGVQSGSKLTADEWQTISTHWKESLNERIQTLTRLRDELDRCIGCGCLSLTDCPLRNPDDTLGQQGAGPRILTRD